MKIALFWFNHHGDVNYHHICVGEGNSLVPNWRRAIARADDYAEPHKASLHNAVKFDRLSLYLWIVC